MKLHKHILFFLLLTGITGLQAQNVLQKQLVGKWKLSAMKFKGLYIDFSTEEKLKKTAYESFTSLKGSLTEEDSAKVEEVATMFKEQFSKLYLDFNADNTYSGVIELEGKSDDATGKYAIKGKQLILTEDGIKKVEKIDFEMPNSDTFVWKKEDEGEKMEIIFTRR